MGKGSGCEAGGPGQLQARAGIVYSLMNCAGVRRVLPGPASHLPVGLDLPWAGEQLAQVRSQWDPEQGCCIELLTWCSIEFSRKKKQTKKHHSFVTKLKVIENPPN